MPDPEQKTPAAKKSASVTAVETIEAFETKFKPLIAVKVKAGLTRAQAIQVIRDQITADSKIADAQLAACKKK